MTTAGAAPPIEESRAFYDGFLERRMLEYRVAGNPRLEAALDLVRSKLAPDTRVLEIGCGIGVVTEAIAKGTPRGRVWACDLSPANVAFARRTLPSDRVDLFVCDVLDGFDVLRAHVTEPVDLLVMVDVLEHLPMSRQEELFERIGALLAPRATALFTFPSAEYQRNLKAERRDELQPVDEEIEAGHMERLAALAGMELASFRKIDVWKTRQYVHCVLERGGGLEAPRHSLGRRAIGRARNELRRRLIEPLRRRRYRRVLASLAHPDGSRDA